MRCFLLFVLVVCSVHAGNDASTFKWAVWAEQQYLPEASILFEKVLASESSPPDLKARACQRLALAALRDGQPEKAEEWARQAAEWSGGRPLPAMKSEIMYSAVSHSADLDRLDDIRHKLETIIIPKLSFEEEPIENVVHFLIQQSILHDMEGRGINIVLQLDGKGTDIGVTMDFDNIALADAIRYICQGVGLKYQIEPFAVFIADPGYSLDEMKLELFPVDSGFMDIKLSDRDDDETTRSPREFFEELGVEFPNGAWARWFKKKGKLVVFNTPRNIARIHECSIVFDGGYFTSPLLSCQVLEVPREENPLPGTLETRSLSALLKREHRWLSKLASVGINSMECVLAQADGMSFNATPVIQSDHDTTELALDWSWQTPEGLKLTYKSDLRLLDQESLAIPIEQLADRERYLVITVVLLSPSGNPLR